MAMGFYKYLCHRTFTLVYTLIYPYPFKFPAKVMHRNYQNRKSYHQMTVVIAMMMMSLTMNLLEKQPLGF